MARRLSLETHDYDGTLHGTYLNAVARDPTAEAAIPSMAQAVERFMALLMTASAASVDPATKRHAAHMVNVIARGRGNLDPKNNLDAGDLFRRVMARDVEVPVLLDVVAEIKTRGSCPQGRTTRLLQLYLSLLPPLDPSTPTP